MIKFCWSLTYFHGEMYTHVPSKQQQIYSSFHEQGTHCQTFLKNETIGLITPSLSLSFSLSHTHIQSCTYLFQVASQYQTLPSSTSFWERLCHCCFPLLPCPPLSPLPLKVASSRHLKAERKKDRQKDKLITLPLAAHARAG